jgi:hypothetical protein
MIEGHRAPHEGENLANVKPILGTPTIRGCRRARCGAHLGRLSRDGRPRDPTVIVTLLRNIGSR